MSTDADHALAAYYRDRPVLVTGGAGFIGSHLVDALVEAGAAVRVIDDLSNGREANLSHLAGRIRFVRGSILDPVALDGAVGGCSIVFHQAALGSVPASVENPGLYHEVNGAGTLRVLEAARQVGVSRVVYAGSSSVYGESEALPKIETMLPSPVSPYGVSKLMGEHWLRAYAHCYGLSGVTLRYFNVFGPRQRPDSAYAAVVPAFAAALCEGRRPVIYGDGLQSRDFTYVANVVRANLLAGESSRDLKGEAVNTACGERFTLLELLGEMNAILGTALKAEHRPARVGDVRHSHADIRAARDVIGFEPSVSFRDGLRATLAADR